LVVGAERRAIDGAVMTFQNGDLLATFRIPDTRGAVSRRRRHPLAIAAECRTKHVVSMAFEDGDLVAAFRIPDACGVVVRRRHHQLAITAERRGFDRLRMPIKLAVQPRGERPARQLAFQFAGERSYPREVTAGWIDLERVTHGTI